MHTLNITYTTGAQHKRGGNRIAAAMLWPRHLPATAGHHDARPPYVRRGDYAWICLALLVCSWLQGLVCSWPQGQVCGDAGGAAVAAHAELPGLSNGELSMELA